MTVKEALTAVVSLPAESGLLDKTLVDNGLNGSDTYSRDLMLQIDAAAVDALFAMWTTPNVSEGGFSLSYDSKALEAKLSALAVKCGRKDVLAAMEPTITSKRPW